MPGMLDQQKAIMAQRMGGSPGAMGGSTATPPPQFGTPQQGSGGAPSSRLAPLLQQVLQILVEGNPADLQEFGKFMAQLQNLVQAHEQGQGGPPQGQPMGGAPPQQAMPPQQPMR